MKATLFYLVLDVTAALISHIAQHLTEYPFQRVVTHLTTGWSFGILDRLVTVIADVESSAVKVTGVLGGITITTAQFGDILLRTEYTGHNQLMHGDTLDIKAVEEGLSDILQQHSGTRHQIRDAGVKRVDVVIGIRPHIDQFALTRLSILTVLDRRDAPLLGSHQLHGIRIGKSLSIAGNRQDAMSLGRTDGRPNVGRHGVGSLSRRAGYLWEEQTDNSQQQYHDCETLQI